MDNLSTVYGNSTQVKTNAESKTFHIEPGTWLSAVTLTATQGQEFVTLHEKLRDNRVCVFPLTLKNARYCMLLPEYKSMPLSVCRCDDGLVIGCTNGGFLHGKHFLHIGYSSHMSQGFIRLFCCAQAVRFQTEKGCIMACRTNTVSRFLGSLYPKWQTLHSHVATHSVVQSHANSSMRFSVHSRAAMCFDARRNREPRPVCIHVASENRDVTAGNFKMPVDACDAIPQAMAAGMRYETAANGFLMSVERTAGGSAHVALAAGGDALAWCAAPACRLLK